MKPNAPIPHPVRSATALLALVFAASLAAQQPDEKPAPTPDPVKGMHDMTPMSAAEIEARHAAPRMPHAAGLEHPAAASPLPADRVFYDAPGDGRVWAHGASYKASFGADGFVFIPFLGSDAPRNFPVQFMLRSVRVGGEPLALPPAAPEHVGDRVVFARGTVREIYDLAPEQVAQTFVVDTPRAGDVDVELAVVTELAEDPDTRAIDFKNGLGAVNYGSAFLVVGDEKRAIGAAYAGGCIRIHVPAALRGDGPVVIDPIINTTAIGPLANDSSQPDVAYDATTDQYLVVWQHYYSATDTDVWSQFWDGGGSPIVGTLASIDLTTFLHTNPRVANLNAYDRFLVVSQRYEGGRWHIYGRLRLAAQPPHAIVFQIDDPAESGHCINPDIGGDPATAGSCDRFLVVWQREYAANDFDIHARQVRADTLLVSSTIYVENSASTIHSMPSVSQSNGNGYATAARWLVAYQFRYSATDEDIYGAVIAQNGTIAQLSSGIDVAVNTDLVPSVSSPATDWSGGAPMFMVTYERQNPLGAQARILTANLLNHIAGPIDLSGIFGLGPYWVRCESDGNRFAVVTGAAAITLTTFAMGNGALVPHDGPHALPLPLASWPRICSRRSSGGLHTDFGVTYVDENWFPDRIALSAYRGHAFADFTRRVMGCNGLHIDVGGRAMLAESMTFTLSNFGADLPGFVFSSPVPATTSVCASCPLGVAQAGAIALIGSSMTINVPASYVFVGFTAAVQGFAFGSGPCIATLRFSDTIDFTIG